jgi:hypothetical protein
LDLKAKYIVLFQLSRVKIEKDAVKALPKESKFKRGMPSGKLKEPP